jgi:hypothetical protein
MRLVGIAVRMETEGRPTARGILTETGSAPPVIVDSFALTGDDVDFTRQLFELSQSTKSRMEALRPDKVVVCRADFPPQQSRREGPKLRLLAEGAIAAAAREVVPDTFLATGKELGEWDHSSKDEVKAKATAMVQAQSMPLKWVGAAMATIGAIARP